MKNLILIVLSIFIIPLLSMGQEAGKEKMKTKKAEQLQVIEEPAEVSPTGEVMRENPESQQPNSQIGEKMSEEDMMNQWMELISLGEEHKEMAETVGEYSYLSTFWTHSGADPMKSKGETTIKAVMDGRYVTETHKGEVMGMPFHGMGMNGYDKLTGEYVSTWMDNMGTGIMKFIGSKNAEGQIVSTTETINVMTRQPETHKTVMTYKKNGHVMDYYIIANGEEFLSMNIIYERR